MLSITRMRYFSSNSKTDSKKVNAKSVRQCCPSRRNVAILAIYDFASSASERNGRRNRSLEKRQEHHVERLVNELASLNFRRLEALKPLINDEHIAQIKIAAKLPISNQGRKRQVNLVSKIFRQELDPASFTKLEAAVRTGSSVVDGDVQVILDVWVEGLLEDDKDVTAEVYGYSPDLSPDHQQVRQLVRMCQQAIKKEEDEAAAAAANASSEDQGTDAELRELLEKPRHARAQTSREPKSALLVRDLKNLLRPLAVRVHSGELS